MKELMTIVDFSVGLSAGPAGPCIDRTTFPDAAMALSTAYWSSTPGAGASTEAWTVNFGSLTAEPLDEVFMNAVRCVR
jgi:hypothetical protein